MEVKLGNEKPITIQQASETTGISVATINRAVRLGALKAERYGNVWVFTPSELTRWVKESYNPNMKRK